MRGGDPTLEERYAAAVAKREKLERERDAAAKLIDEKAQANGDPALTALRTLRATEAKLTAATANREKADRELGVVKKVQEEKADEEDGDDDGPPVDKDFFAARLKGDKIRVKSLPPPAAGRRRKTRRTRRAPRRSTRGRRR